MFFQGNEKYNCATYLRLSRSDGDQQESNSIKNQRALLNDYMEKHPELHKFDEYVDDGYSGTNFERPDFKRMMQDIEKRNVNCIIRFSALCRLRAEYDSPHGDEKRKEVSILSLLYL